MRRQSRKFLALLFAPLLAFGLSACNSRSRAQTQSEKDQETRQKVADATAKAKQEGEKAAQELRQEAREAGHEAKVAAQGVNEGWHRDQQGRLDINSATEPELRSVGFTTSQARQIINGRPYKTRHELVARGIITPSGYSNIRDRITVLSPDHSSHPASQ
ncbi:MAG TPA: hypothetical protein VGZ29_11700 [Terriglobia bacterium]|nr:hypothetical protein [Terriglobia bacterium]